MNALPFAPPTSLAIRSPYLFLLYQDDGEGEVLVLHQVGNADHFIKEVDEPAYPRRFAASDRLARAAAGANDPLVPRDWKD